MSYVDLLKNGNGFNLLQDDTIRIVSLFGIYL